MMYTVRRPLITEKNTFHNAAGVYVFEVDPKATKTEIKDAVEKSFRVRVKSVNTLVCRGHAKRNRFGKGRVPRWKKALVRVFPGEKIALFEGV